MKNIQETVEYIRKCGITDPETGIILGTGLGNLINEIKIIKSVEYSDIPHFPVSTVESHQGKLIYGVMKGKKVLAMQGRFHYYEGYSMQQITLPVRVMKLLGIRHLLISNAGGAMNPQFKKGNLMLIDDHINFQPENPLRGKNLNEMGPRFPDMSRPYSSYLNEKLMNIARKNDIILYQGVYVAVPGPNLETRAEYRYLRSTGADVVGMSTVPEVIVANHIGLPCCAISVLTDECDPDNLKPVGIEEILAVAAKAEVNLTRLYSALVEDL